MFTFLDLQCALRDPCGTFFLRFAFTRVIRTRNPEGSMTGLFWEGEATWKKILLTHSSPLLVPQMLTFCLDLDEPCWSVQLSCATWCDLYVLFFPLLPLENKLAGSLRGVFLVEGRDSVGRPLCICLETYGSYSNADDQASQSRPLGS